MSIYRLLAESTIEARVMGLQAHKRQVVHELINDSNKEATGQTVGRNSKGGKSERGQALWASLATASASSSSSSEASRVGALPAEEYGTLDLDHFLESVGFET